ncbi:MAG TPA: 5-oxoprolinase subunit PxpA [Gemmatimonadaceae bacterium]|nr:5-oxoprolinase subunit PxpA [Gemmatimonadaceae bacterium]
MNAAPDSSPAGRLAVDLNADMGEGFGRYRLNDDALLATVTSASIACGFHAGDPVVMRETVTNAAAHGVTIGAHPGYPDLVGFGRRDLAVTPSEVEAMVVYQIGALQAVCVAAGTHLRFVKPHGSLYNRAARDPATADAIARAVRSVDSSLILLGLAGSALIEAAARVGIRSVSEAFVDRAYRRDGTLVPRTEAGAVLEGAGAVAERALRMVQTGTVLSADGAVVSIRAESLCTHGDGPDAVAIVRAVRTRLEQAGVSVASFARP